MEKKSRLSLHERRRNRRRKLRLLLTDSELEELERAVDESGACSRSLIISEATRRGLLSREFAVTQERRSRRIDAWVPRRMLEELRRSATLHAVTQQWLLRRWLREYVAEAAWRDDEERGLEKENHVESVVL